MARGLSSKVTDETTTGYYFDCREGGDTYREAVEPQYGRLPAHPRRPENSVRSVVYSSDSQQLASASDDNTVRVWEAATGKCIRVRDDRVCAGLDITGTIGLSPGQRTALKLMGAVDHGEEE